MSNNLINAIIIFFRRFRFDQRQRVLNAYDKSIQTQHTSFIDAYKLGWKLIVFSASSPESAVLGFIYSFVLTFAGTFLSPSTLMFPPSTIFLLLMMLISFALIVLVSSFVIPAQIFLNINRHLASTITSTICSIILVHLTPDVWAFTANEALEHSNIAMFFGYFVLVFSSMTIVFIYNSEIMDYSHYRNAKERKFGGFDLPPEVRGTVLLLRAQDHYVEVTTDLGKHLIRMRMSDALKRIKNLNGMQTHRSYWVAKGQIVEIVKDGSRIFARLRTGEEIPVSVSHVKKIREWISQ